MAYMRILIATPIPLTAIGGPASIARILKKEFEESGDTVTVATLTSSERKLPPLIRQGVLFVRAIVLCLHADTLLLLDPASTGISFALAGKITGTPIAVRIGGDFMWETYVERTQQPLLLSEFYSHERALSTYEKIIRYATRITLKLSDRVVFTTPWLKEIWFKPYRLENTEIHIIANPIAEREEAGIPLGKVFLAAGRDTRIKNMKLLKEEVWPAIQSEYPDAVLDVTPKSAEEYREAIKSSYALIIPTLSEVSPNSMFEAIRYGKPFISTKDNGLYEQYKEAGLFVDARDPEAFKAAIRELLDEVGYKRALEKVQNVDVELSPAQMAAAFRTVLMG